MKRQNTNRSPIFSSPKTTKKKGVLKKQGTGIFGRFSPEAWPASDTKTNTDDAVEKFNDDDLTDLNRESKSKL